MTVRTGSAGRFALGAFLLHGDLSCGPGSCPEIAPEGPGHNPPGFEIMRSAASQIPSPWHGRVKLLSLLRKMGLSDNRYCAAGAAFGTVVEEFGGSAWAAVPPN